MKRTVLYGILFAVPGIGIAFLISYLSTGFVLGFIWLFIFGDNSWPEWISIVVPIFSICIFLGTWIMITIWGYKTGDKLAGQTHFNYIHLSYSVIATLIPVSFFALQHLRVTGEVPPSLTCGNYCQSQGFTTSSMPPAISNEKTCNCLDDLGITTVTIDLDEIINAK